MDERHAHCALESIHNGAMGGGLRLQNGRTANLTVLRNSVNNIHVLDLRLYECGRKEFMQIINCQ